MAIPHDFDAEEVVLGICLNSYEALGWAIDWLTPMDFYRPAHRNAFAAMVDTYRSGGTIDATSVLDGLKRAGVTGVTASDILGWQANAPATSSIKRVGEIVQRHAYARSALGVALELAEALQDPTRDPLEAVASRVADLGAVETPLIVRDPGDVSAGDLINEPLDETTPWIIPGLLRIDWRAMFVGVEGGGRALALDTPIPSPDGWTTMGEIAVGDSVFDEEGRACSVVAATEVMLDRPCYRLKFSDGTTVVADAMHEWVTVPYEGRQSGRWDRSIVTTAAMAQTIRARDGFVRNYAVELCGELEYPEQDLPVHPYVLGAWLGDGTSRSAALTSADEDIPNEIRKLGYVCRKVGTPLVYWICDDERIADATGQAVEIVRSGVAANAAAKMCGISKDRVLIAAANAGIQFVNRGGDEPKTRVADLPPRLRQVQSWLGRLGLLQNKHIPTAYLRSAPWQRLALLQGLMDTDGTVGLGGDGVGRGFGASKCEFVSCEKRLADDVLELCLSLGLKAVMREAPSVHNGRPTGATKYRISFQTDKPVFRMERKLQRLVPLRTHRALVRYIESVEPVESVPVRCIQVSSESSCFLATKAMIPTHNSVLLRQLAFAPAYGMHPFTTRPVKIEPVRTLIIDLENPRKNVRDWLFRIQGAAERYAGDIEGRERCRVWMRPDGIDLRKRNDRAELEDILRRHRPQLVCLGPLYKSHNPTSQENYEVSARGLQDVLDALRVRFGFALVIEHHAPNGSAQGRELRPEGSSLWRRWGELRWKLLPVKDEAPYRTKASEPYPVRAMRREPFAGDRVEHSWPDAFFWGARHALPWEGYWPNGQAENPGQDEEMF